MAGADNRIVGRHRGNHHHPSNTNTLRFADQDAVGFPERQQLAGVTTEVGLAGSRGRLQD
jgi:hypothetical protein